MCPGRNSGRWVALALPVLLGTCLSFTWPVRTAAPALEPDLEALAVAATGDLVRHFWTGDESTGHIRDANISGFGGGPGKWDRPVPWEQAGMVSVLANLYEVRPETSLRKRIAAEWAYLRRRFSAAELESCGNNSLAWGDDDAGWNATLYLNVYATTKDPSALAAAAGLFNNAYQRWADGAFGGGLSPNDRGGSRAIVQSALIQAGFRLYTLTRVRGYFTRSLALYTWVEKNMLRPDGLYGWMYEGPPGHGLVALGPPREALSDTFLAGNMAMGVIHARLYQQTKDTVYRDRALRTADAITASETDGKGHYLDDRDAWANGYFMGEWAREVLTLPGCKKENIRLLKETALAIHQRDRTPDGLYGGCWNGPLGSGCPWNDPPKNGYAGLRSLPEHIMTSSSAVNVIVAAAQVQKLGL